MIAEEIAIRELTDAGKDQVNTIAGLHMKAFPGFFLTRLGRPFLKTLYTGFLSDENSGIVVAQRGASLVGFIAYSRDYPAFFNGLVKKHLLKFAFCSLGAIIRHPTFVKRLFGAFKKSEEVVKDSAYVELASIGVDPDCTGIGVGSEMIEFLIAHTDFEKYPFLNLETDAEDNQAANRFYLKNGFELYRTFTTPQGRQMNEYRYYPRKDG